MSWFWLKVSRPGLWFQTLWLYLLPTSQHPEVFSRLEFWVGAVFVTYPLNLLVYGWNDVVDREVDRLNPRKDSFLFGARGGASELASVPTLVATVNLPFFVVLSWLGGPRVAALLLGIVAVNAVYNQPRRGLRGRPPFELVNQLGYLLLLPLSSQLNAMPHLRAGAVLYLVLFCTHAHLMGEIMDVDPDRLAGRRTTATVIGVLPAKGLVLALVLVESLLLLRVFDERALAGFLALGALWLALDLFVLWRGRPYSRRQFQLFGLALNAFGFASIAWVWWRGSLTP